MAERTVIGDAAMPRGRVRGIAAVAVLVVLAGAGCLRRDSEECRTAASTTSSLELSCLTSATPTIPRVVASAPVVPIPLLVVVPRAQGCRAILGAQCIACDAFRCDGTEACYCDDVEPTETAR